MKIKEYVVQDKEEYDEILHRRGFNVNMRLYNSNVIYRRLIQDIIQYMMCTKNLSFGDYPKVKGISGANIGIPLNLVIVGNKVMINPTIVAQDHPNTFFVSTCGSIPDARVTVIRPSWITVEYFDINGKKDEETFTDNVGTICHEIEHNLGILITDYRR